MWSKLLQLLPETYQNKLSGKDNIRKIAFNAAWLFSDKILRMAITLFVTGWLARYLSLDEFGKLNNAIAYAVLFGAIASLGLDTILLRDLVRNPGDKNQLLGSAFFLKLSGGLFSYLMCIVTVFILRPGEGESMNRILTAIICFGLVFQSFDVIDIFFQSVIKSKYAVIARNISFVLVNIAKIALIYFGYPLIYFGWIWLLEFALNALCLYLVYRNKHERFSSWKFNSKTAKNLLLNSWPLYLGLISAFTYMKIDQLMIAKMLGDEQAGLFAGAAKIFDLSFFIIPILAGSIFPSLINVYELDKKLFLNRYEQVTSLFTLLGYVVCLSIALLSGFIIHILYGQQFTDAIPVLMIQMLSLLFMFNGGLRSSYFAATNRYKIFIITTGGSAIINIILNYILIKKMGIIGAALATAITHFVSLFFSNIFFKDIRSLFFIQLRSFNPLNILGLIKKSA